jgi:SAM-dependent methyltransferase
MIAQATKLATDQGAANVRFEVADITELPYSDNTFDSAFSCAVLEHLPDPVKALKEICRVLKPGGVAGLINTDWGDPLISPESEAVTKFFKLFEEGFNRQGGSLNRGRHLRLIMQEAGFDVVEFFAAYGNATTPDLVQAEINGYIAWTESLPWFDQAIELNLVDRPALDEIIDGMRRWSELPEAFIAKGRCVAIGRKKP